jgi:hypothetical protein
MTSGVMPPLDPDGLAAGAGDSVGGPVAPACRPSGEASHWSSAVNGGFGAFAARG